MATIAYIPMNLKVLAVYSDWTTEFQCQVFSLKMIYFKNALDWHINELISRKKFFHYCTCAKGPKIQFGQVLHKIGWQHNILHLKIRQNQLRNKSWPNFPLGSICVTDYKRLVVILKLQFSKSFLTTMATSLWFAWQRMRHILVMLSVVCLCHFHGVVICQHIVTWIHISYFELICQYVKQSSSLSRHMSSNMDISRKLHQSYRRHCCKHSNPSKSFGLLVLFFSRP